MTKAEKQIARNRVSILTDLNSIIAVAEKQTERVRNVGIVDDDEFADAVQGYADRIHEILEDLCDLRNSKHLKLERGD